MWFLCCMSTCATYSSLKADLRFEHTCKSPFQPFPCVPLSKSDTGVHSQRLVSDTIEPLLSKEQLVNCKFPMLDPRCVQSRGNVVGALENKPRRQFPHENMLSALMLKMGDNRGSRGKPLNGQADNAPGSRAVIIGDEVRTKFVPRALTEGGYAGSKTRSSAAHWLHGSKAHPSVIKHGVETNARDNWDFVSLLRSYALLLHTVDGKELCMA